MKEVHFFNRFDSNGNEIDNYERRGLDWYEAHFNQAPAGSYVGEATPMYLCDPEAPSRIKTTLPEARFIVMLREPVSRAWSHYRMARAKAHVQEDLDMLIERQDPHILARGLYAAQLSRWFALFPQERFLVLFFEEVMANPQPSLTELADWLNVDAAPLLLARPEEARNAATGYRSARFYNASVRIARGLRNSRLTRGLASRLKAAGVYDVVKSANRSAPESVEMTSSQRFSLEKYYSEDVETLTQLLGHPLTFWLEEKTR